MTATPANTPKKGFLVDFMMGGVAAAVSKTAAVRHMNSLSIPLWLTHL